MTERTEYVIRDADRIQWTQYAPPSAAEALSLVAALNEQYHDTRYAPFTAHLRTITETPLKESDRAEATE